MIDYYYVSSLYFATGEGMTINMLITRAYPRPQDYKDKTYSELINTGEDRAIREFGEKFSHWASFGAEILSREEFLKRHRNHLPQYVEKVIMDDTELAPGNFNYFAQIHTNYS